jgi:hypothetical protein
MKRKTKFVMLSAILLMLAGGLVSCKDKDEKFTNDGLVRDYGSPATDGCGWVICIDNTAHAPINLDNQLYHSKFEEFCIDSLKVRVTYKKLPSFRNCNWWVVIGDRIYPEIEIISIKIR